MQILTWFISDDPNFHPKWNSLDGNINRKSHIGDYAVLNGRPLNPEGRTGIKGRGVLGRWGPNHAADPIVTRWKMDNGTKILHTVTKLAILQFCAIQRHDTHEWAVPGGMVDPGEQVSITLKREFMEEAMNSLQSSPGQLEKNKQMVEKFFNTGEIVYKGYVDDPRNTDNAWIETVAANFHDEDGTSVGQFELNAGDDAKNVKWMDIDKNLNLYASHSQLIQYVVKLRGAHW
ncbi:ADP-ribose pyrophosphatase, mitochondrial-like isoform X2 [Agrilus planipennis]|uniref:ADP-ribose pyrophosphatase, mitochondrial isoform X2 n=1 Tax=Agrilus planipennis TaxID=224129 RepID=A0A1W4WGD1_AGRPL|nr:ADP-ribose pyrophosphatase, mitochondrial isoform X2 [Agrilus planipennis]XP_025831837.1 ADP-ribose pyrophosphatase, mitochondrial-like isoform X2 [Agrilus planipennis]